MSDMIDMAVEGAPPAPPARNLDLSAFELRWAEALGAPDSDKVADFKTACASVDPVWENASRQMRSLLAKCTASSVPGGRVFLMLELILSLEKRGSYFFVIRPFYESLYQAVTEKWQSDGEDRVLVRGNAGTGLSWFQPYALRRLLQGYGNDHEYFFVVRQVQKKLYLIDLSNAEVRQFKVDEEEAVDCLDLFNHKRVLYFFEPLNDRVMLPLPLQLSSLTTLSLFEERTHEYEKSRIVRLMFPCWTFEKLSVSAETDSGIQLELEEVANRFRRFGGIIRLVSGANTQSFESNQKDRINYADLAVLRATTTGIDSDPQAPGNNVSGYLLSS